MPTVAVKTGGTIPVGAAGEAAEFLDLFLEKAGFVEECRWEARLEKTAPCGWDSPPVRVVGYKHGVLYLRVKPSINATVDHFVSLLIPDGRGYAAETVYKQLKALVPSFNRFIRTQGHRKKMLEPTMTHDAPATTFSAIPRGPSAEDAAPVIDPGSLLIRLREKAQEWADAGRRLEANRQKYLEHQAEIKRLDDEYQEISKSLTDRETLALLSRLLELQSTTAITT